MPLDGLDSTVEPYSPLLGVKFLFLFFVFVESVDDSRLEQATFFQMVSLEDPNSKKLFTVGLWMSLGFISGRPQDWFVEFVFKFCWSPYRCCDLSTSFCWSNFKAFSLQKPLVFDSK